MTGQITLIFQYSLQGAPRQARRAACWGGSGEVVKTSMRAQTGGRWCREARREAAPLTRRRPGLAAGALQPGRCCTRCARGLAGAPLGRRPRRWRLDTGSRALQGERGESRAKFSEAHLPRRKTATGAFLLQAEAGHLPPFQESGS